MSEQPNVTLVLSALEAFGRGDVPTILDHCSGDCEFYCPGPASVPFTGRMKGRAEIQGYFDNLLGTQSGTNLQVEQVVAQGDAVVLIGRYTTKVNATGKSLDSPIVLTFHVQDGKIVRHMVIGDTAALAESYDSAGTP